MSKKRKNYTAEEKITILKKHLLEKMPVSDLCDQHGLHPTVFHRWMKEFFENAALAFQKQKDTQTKQLEKKVSQLEGISGKFSKSFSYLALGGMDFGGMRQR